MNSFSQGSRNSNLIDVNQNNNLLSSSYQLSGEKHAAELQEQIKAYKKELAKKDELIANLSAITPRSDNSSLIEAMNNATLSDDKTVPKSSVYSMDSPQAELAAAKIKIESISAELRQVQTQLDVKDGSIHELRSKVQLLKENDARQSVLLQGVKDDLKLTQQQRDALEKITDKGSVTVQALQNENREAQEKILELESKLRDHVLAKEEIRDETETFKRKFHDTIIQFGEALDTDTENGHRENIAEILSSKAKSLCQEQSLLQSRNQTLDDALNAHGLEVKASRETIMRLVAEVGKEQKNASEAVAALEKVKQERDDTALSKESLVREIELLKDRLAANDKTFASSRDEISQTAAKANTLAEDVKRLEREKLACKLEYKSFCEAMAKVLSDSFVSIEPQESQIMERVRSLVASEQERKKHIEHLEIRLRDLDSQLNRQNQLQYDSERRVKKVESSVYLKENRLQDLQDEIASVEVIRDTLRRDKTKHLAFLQQIAEAMKMEEVAADLGYDFNTEVLIARAHQLAKLESDALVEKTSANYNLHRKVKAMKEEVRNKEMHMELLRKKISELEEKVKTKNGLALDRDDAIVTIQRLQRKVERLQHALGDERVKVGRLKAELAETNQLKTITIEQRRKIDELVNSLGKVSSAKDRQRMKLSSLKRSLSANELTSDERITRLQSQLQAVTNDLKSTKGTLDEVSRREKQLVDFREVIARLLGLDVSTLSVPDYEVISRVEKLIRNQHIEALASGTYDNSLGVIGSPFRPPYEGGQNRSPSPSRYHTPSPPQMARESEVSGPKRHYRRSRSPSPKRY